MVVTNLGEFISQETSRIVSAISQNNSNNESEQENQHEPKFICYEVNSDNEIVWKECDKAEDSLEEPADKAVGRAKNVLQKRKYSNERKSRNRKQSTFSCSESETIERERRKIKCSRQKWKVKLLSSLNVSSSGFTTDLYWLQLLIKDS